MKKYSVVISESLNSSLLNHLIREDGQEDLCFALYQLGTGNKRLNGIITDIILPENHERNLHGNVSFNPSFFDRVITEALKENKGIAFLHSHPSSGWQGMSQDDIETEKMLSPRIKGSTCLPLIGMTLGVDGSWSARFWEKVQPKKYEIRWCESVRVVGKKFSVTFNDKLLPSPKFEDEFIRTISAWGEKQQSTLARIKVAVVGVGSVGSQIAEALLRTGVQKISLIDFDLIQRKNLDRLHGIKPKYIKYLKTDVYKHILNKYKLYPSQEILSIPFSIIEEYGLNSLIDCDMIFCCVDRPWPRFVLNCVAYAYNIPVIDGGIDSSYSVKKNNIDQARWRTYVAGYSRRCIKCMGQYKPEDVALEQSGLLEDPKYIKDLPVDHFSKRGENVYAFSMALAGLQVQQYLSMVLMPKGVYYGAKEMDFVTGNIDPNFRFECDDNCEFPNQIFGMGDSIKSTLVDVHPLAEQTRRNALVFDTKKAISDKLVQFLKYFRIKK